MSLYALPVSVADLEQLQLGIQFYTNVAEATTEAALINAGSPGQTVFSYAEQLLAANISTSQVAMADNTLMYDQLASVSTLSTQCVGPPAPGFLPSQVTYAIAHGFDPTVFAAQALGLALSNPLGGTNNFQTNYGGLSNTAFASAAAIAIFGSATPGLVNFALSHVAYWTNFYTVNGINGDTTPTAAQIQIAAYGATFGEMVGVALENPSVAPVLVADVANALILNGELLYPAGGNTAGGFETLPPHIPLQGESAAIGQTIVLTPGQDTAISGQTYIPGIAGGPTPPIVASSDVTISGLLGGVFGNQPTLTAGDNIQLNGNFNALIATFNTNGTYTVAGETIKGVQTWTFSNFGTGVVNILGGVNVGGPGPLGGTNNPGVQTLTYSDSGAGSTLNVGTAGAGIQSVLTTINSTF